MRCVSVAPRQTHKNQSICCPSGSFGLFFVTRPQVQSPRDESAPHFNNVTQDADENLVHI